MALTDLLAKVKIGEDETSDALDDPLTSEDAEIVEPDPKPSRAAKAPPKAPPPKITVALRKEVRDKLSMMLDVPAMFWAARDPYCAGVFNAQQEEIVERLTTVACRNRRVLAWLTSTGEYTDWIMLLTAVWPVVVAVWSHHVARSVPEEGLSGDYVPDGWSGAGPAYPPHQQPAYQPYSV